MMSIKEYAKDIGKSILEVLLKCEELQLNVNKEDDDLGEDDIIKLDNSFNEEIEDNNLEVVQEEDNEEQLNEIISQVNIQVDDTIKTQKLKKNLRKKTLDFVNQKKQMYKNKEKLISNLPIDKENVIIYHEGMKVNELAEALNVNGVDLVKKLMNLGIMANLNSSINFADAELVIIDYNKELKRAETQDEINFEKLEINDDKDNLADRSPVVTIMGHVDHGKTTLLDVIRETNVVSSEAGGITQHIGAYQVEWNDKKITFIDTPGHEAFTEMRARGASITDIVIIIVAADDGVMPQTIEAIDHAKVAKVPIIVAINKIDKPGADSERIMADMAKNGLTPEEWGGDTLFVKISALEKTGIKNLLETIILVAEMEELKANPNRYAIGTVIEARLDKNVGPITTLIIQNGTLRLGDPIVVGTTYGKVRTLKNDKNEEILEAPPSTPVEITGLNEVPTAGDKFMAFETEKKARSIADTRREKLKQKDNLINRSVSLEDLFIKIQEGKKVLNVILKTDVKGSEEALKKALQKINIEGVKVKIIRSGTGTITESDVILASTSEAIIIGFNVRPNNKTIEVAKEYNVDIRFHNIIYKVVEELEFAMKGLLDPVFEEKVLGQAEIRKLFKFSKVGIIAGCYVIDGIIKNNAKVRIIRDGIVIYDGNISSVKREKKVVKEVKKGFECGITIENYNDLKENDIIEVYEEVEIRN